jgi:cell division protein FtsI (penicillin-binding protein 3)
MKIYIFFFLILFTFCSCNKSKLFISKSLEKEIGESAYNSTTKNSNGYNVKTFIDTTIQKIAENTLKDALITNKADYGCLVIMETSTGKIKAMVNLNKDLDGNYKYKTTTAVSQANEPGGLIKTYDLLALLEDNKVDTTAVFDTHDGEIDFFGKKIQDSHVINGKISLAKAYQISSNTVFAQVINTSYSSNPNLFCNRFKALGFDKSLNLPFTNEAVPSFLFPKSKQWSSISLPWMSLGYGFTLTPIQILTFYNAIANNGVMLKPLFLSEINDKNGNLKIYNTEVLNSKIASAKTMAILHYLLTKKANGDGSSILTSKKIKIAGTGAIVRMDYANSRFKEKRCLASYAGYFPAKSPKYSIVCFIYNPKIEFPVYAAIVCGKAIQNIVENVE